MSNPNINHMFPNGGPTNHQNFINMGNAQGLPNHHQNPGSMHPYQMNGHMMQPVGNSNFQMNQPNMNNFGQQGVPVNMMAVNGQMAMMGHAQMGGPSNPNGMGNLHMRHGSGGQNLNQNPQMQQQVHTIQSQGPMLQRQTGTVQTQNINKNLNQINNNNLPISSNNSLQQQNLPQQPNGASPVPGARQKTGFTSNSPLAGTNSNMLPGNYPMNNNQNVSPQAANQHNLNVNPRNVMGAPPNKIQKFNLKIKEPVAGNNHVMMNGQGLSSDSSRNGPGPGGGTGPPINNNNNTNPNPNPNPNSKPNSIPPEEQKKIEAMKQLFRRATMISAQLTKNGVSHDSLSVKKSIKDVLDKNITSVKCMQTLKDILGQPWNDEYPDATQVIRIIEHGAEAYIRTASLRQNMSQARIGGQTGVNNTNNPRHLSTNSTDSSEQPQKLPKIKIKPMNPDSSGPNTPNVIRPNSAYNQNNNNNHNNNNNPPQRQLNQPTTITIRTAQPDNANQNKTIINNNSQVGNNITAPQNVPRQQNPPNVVRIKNNAINNNSNSMQKMAAAADNNNNNAGGQIQKTRIINITNQTQRINNKNNQNQRLTLNKSSMPENQKLSSTSSTTLQLPPHPGHGHQNLPSPNKTDNDPDDPFFDDDEDLFNNISGVNIESEASNLLNLSGDVIVNYDSLPSVENLGEDVKDGGRLVRIKRTALEIRMAYFSRLFGSRSGLVRGWLLENKRLMTFLSRISLYNFPTTPFSITSSKFQSSKQSHKLLQLSRLCVWAI